MLEDPNEQTLLNNLLVVDLFLIDSLEVRPE